MMTENSVKNKECETCGADIRPNSQFCYNCGGSFSPEAVVTEQDKNSVSEIWFREQIGDEKTNGGKPAEIEDKKEIEPVNEKTDESESEPEKKKSEITPDAESPKQKEETNLKSAAALRRKPKTAKAKNTEIIWEEHDDAPNVWFILVAVVLAVFAAVVLYLALYYR